MDARHKVYTVRNGSCGNKILRDDVPRIVRALVVMELVSPDTMIRDDDDDDPAVFPGQTIPPRAATPARRRRNEGGSGVAKIEANDASVSLDLIVRALLILGATPRAIGKSFADAP